MKRVIITGGTGLIGSHLAKKLAGRGYSVVPLGKNDLSAFLSGDHSPFSPEDSVIHLAGAGVGDKRWSSGRRRIIAESRLNSGEAILDSLRKHDVSIRVFISASATGYYGSDIKNRVLTEEDPPGDDFLAQTCIQWESMALSSGRNAVRTVIIRTGVVFATSGGALARLVPPARLGLAVIAGSGRQYMPWIHIDDLCEIYIRALEDDMITGPWNAVAPAFNTYTEVAHSLAGCFSRHFVNIRIPSFFFRLIFGEMSVIVLEGSRVSARKLRDSGFQFSFPDLGSCLQNLFMK